MIKKGTKIHRYTVLDCILIAYLRNSEFLSDSCPNCKTKLKWRCEKKHEFEIDLDHVINENQWCPECGKYHGSIKIESGPLFEKHCGRCDKIKPSDQFNNSKKFDDGKRFYCKECQAKEAIAYRAKNREVMNEKTRAYHINNRDKESAYRRERYKNDIQYRIGCNLRRRLHHAIKGNYKGGSAVRDLGCTIEALIEYFKPLFLCQPSNPITGDTMSWDNYGEWHIDHIKPLASFDLTDREQLLEACNFHNLQPLWAKENISKGAKIQ